MNSVRIWLKRLLFFVPLAIGIAVLVIAVRSKSPPPLAEMVNQVRKVRVVRAETIDVVPITTVFGSVVPERTWDAVAEVAGQAIEVNPLLRDGNMVPKGTVLVKIDPTGHDLRRAEIDAQLAEIGVTEENNRTLLEIELRNLALARQSLARKRDLMKKGATSQSVVDRDEQTVLARRAAAQNLRNILSLMPTRRRALEARLAQTERDLAHTIIRAPIDIRIADLKIEAGQYVGIGQTMFRGDSVDRVEITAQVPLVRMQPLIQGLPALQIAPRHYVQAVAQLAKIQAVVRLELGERQIEWPARVVRIDDTIDPKTRTVGVVVAVDNPYRKVQPDAHPPLVKGMFVKVELQGVTQPGRVVIPALAVRQGAVHLIGAGGVLKIQEVSVRYYQGSAAILRDGLVGGETVIVSDLIPAIAGMPVEGVTDDDLAQRTRQAATGGGRQP